MLIKSVVLLVMLFIVISLVSGLFFLVRDKGSTQRTVKALSIRIGLSIALFLFLMVGFYLHWLTPHAL